VIERVYLYSLEELIKLEEILDEIEIKR